MSKRFPLQTLLNLSNLRLDEAAKRLGELIAGEHEANKRLQLLTDYRQEYQERFMAAAQNGLSPDGWQNYRVFLDRLEIAIQQAGEAVKISQRNTASGQEKWLDKRGKVKAFDTLAQRHQARIQHAELRQEQKSLDEHAARQHSKKDKD